MQSTQWSLLLTMVMRRSRLPYLGDLSLRVIDTVEGLFYNLIP